MNEIVIHTNINAPIERCFDLARSIDLHKVTASESKEEAIAGVTQGLISLNETVTWRAKHFGLWFKLKVKITQYERPNYFVDEMLEGAFKFMKHTHQFSQLDSGTLMTDIFKFSSPLGVIGKAVDQMILRDYMERFLINRNRVLVAYAESDKWREVLKY